MELMDCESNSVGNEAESPLANSVIVDALTLARHRKISEPELKSVKYPLTNPALTLGELWYITASLALILQADVSLSGSAASDEKGFTKNTPLNLYMNFKDK